MSSIIRMRQEGEGVKRTQPVAFNLNDVKEHADKYLSEVRARANQVIADAKAETAKVLEQARQEGMRQGLLEAEKSAREEAEKRIDALLPELKKQFESVAQQRDAWLRRWEDNAIRLAVRIAERVVASDRIRTGEPPTSLIREALELVSSDAVVEIRVSKQDHALIDGRITELVQGIDRVSQADIVIDDQLRPGDCLVRTSKGEIDQRVATRLERITQELLGQTAPGSTADEPMPEDHRLEGDTEFS